MRVPLVSVVTVCYNAASTIENTILSVIKQTYDNIEYVIIDGGSKDGTVDIINKYKDRIAVFISEQDKGIYDAMNKGIKASNGDWIIFRNSGDYFADEDSVKQMFSESINDDITILHGNMRGFDKYGYKDQTPPIIQQNYTPVQMPVFHPSTFIRLTYHKNHLFDLRYRSSSDFDFFTKCTLAGCKYQYKPVLVSVMNVGEGMSVDNLKVVYRENYDSLCRNGIIDSTLLTKLKYYKTYYNLKFRDTLKDVLPSSYVKTRILKNKNLDGWTVGGNPIPLFIK